MERKISWCTGCYDEIELVYDKAGQNEITAAILSELETMALREAREGCRYLTIGGKAITEEMFAGMPEHDKETIMHRLADVGLQDFDVSILEGKIAVTFTPDVQIVLGCTMFSVLNRLEKLDGTINAIYPKVALELRVPLGAKKGFSKFEVLISLIYPWLSVSEQSTDTSSVTLNVRTQSLPVDSAQQKATKPKKKKGFFERFFRRK